MPKSPQEYWEDIGKDFPVVFREIGLDRPIRMAFYMGIATTIDFISSLDSVPDKPAAFRLFVQQLDEQREIEKKLREEEPTL